jgi:hypothetical protein
MEFYDLQHGARGISASAAGSIHDNGMSFRGAKREVRLCGF